MMTSTDRGENRSTWRSDRRAAWLVLVPAVLSTIVVLHHPVVHVADATSVDEVVRGIRDIAAGNAAFHAMILAFVLVQAVGLASFAERLGFERLAVRAGTLGYGVATLLLAVAGTIDGFATPLIGRGCIGDASSCAAVAAAALSIDFAWIQAFTKVGLGIQAIALATWSCALVATSRGTLRAVGIAGVVVALGPLALMASSDVAIGPRRLATLLVFASVWSIGAATVLWLGLLDARRAPIVPQGASRD